MQKHRITRRPSSRTVRLALGGAVVVVASCLSATPSLAAGTWIHADKVDKPPVIDGVPSNGEWPRELTKMVNDLKGSPSPKDLSARAAVAYDDKFVYVTADVTDDTLRPGADRVDFEIGTGNSIDTFSLYPGNAGKTAARITKNGGGLRGAKIVEAPGNGAWSIEAAIPWSAIGDGQTRVGFKAGIFIADADSSDAIHAIVGSANGTDPSALPPMVTTPEQAVYDNLVVAKNLPDPPKFAFTDNVAGGSDKERVMIFDKYLVVLGPSIRGGTQFYYSDLSTNGTALEVLSCELRDVDGDGRKEIVLKKRVTDRGVSRDIVDIESFGAGETPSSLFRHEVGISDAKGSVANDFSFFGDGGKLGITITPGSARGLSASNFQEAMETSWDPLLLPWGTIDSQTYKLSGGSFSKSERTHASKSDSVMLTSSSTSMSQPASSQTASVQAVVLNKPSQDKVLGQYRSDRGSSSSPRFDLSGDVDDDGRSERVFLIDKDLVIVGDGFKNGAGYSFTTLSFADAGDITSVSLKDVTGDGKAEIIVRGILKQKNGKDEIAREVELVFRVSGESIKRVFAAEVSRTIGTQKIIASLSYGSGSATLAPSRAVGFTKESYPFNQDTSAVGGIEPLLLPWGEAKSTTYSWNGSQFTK